MRNYYAVEYSNGVAVCANTGKRYGATYHAFPNRRARDTWADGGADYRTEPGWREAVPSSDPELRAELRAEKDPWCPHETIVRHDSPLATA